MDIGSVASASTAMQQTQLMQTIQVSMLKKAMDTEASSVSQLLETVPAMPQQATEGSLGTRVDTYA